MPTILNTFFSFYKNLMQIYTVKYLRKIYFLDEIAAAEDDDDDDDGCLKVQLHRHAEK